MIALEYCRGSSRPRCRRLRSNRIFAYPDDLAVITSATAAHRSGFTGDGVRVAMVDSGQAPHPFSTAHGYRVEPTVPIIPGTDPQVDPIGLAMLATMRATRVVEG